MRWRRRMSKWLFVIWMLRSVMADEANKQTEDGYILLGGRSSSLSAIAVPDPQFGNVHCSSSKFLDWFDANDWDALFINGLGVFDFASKGRVHVQGYEEKVVELQSRFNSSFDEATIKYPMLFRFKDDYEDVIFKEAEVAQLRNECLMVQANMNEPKPMMAVNKLIRICDDASTLN